MVPTHTHPAKGTLFSSPAPGAPLPCTHKLHAQVNSHHTRCRPDVQDPPSHTTPASYVRSASRCTTIMFDCNKQSTTIRSASSPKPQQRCLRPTGPQSLSHCAPTTKPRAMCGTMWSKGHITFTIRSHLFAEPTVMSQHQIWNWIIFARGLSRPGQTLLHKL
jgi:hypothetical protein